jgi:hypothetical protein
MYQQGRFLGGFDWVGQHGHYQDHSSGDVSHFHGREVILVSGVEAYALDYCSSPSRRRARELLSVGPLRLDGSLVMHDLGIAVAAANISTTPTSAHPASTSHGIVAPGKQ